MNAAVLTLDGLRAEFDGPTFQRARALADGRFVKRVEYGADGFIHAQVASSTGYGVYEQRIELIDDGDVVVEGECSCPMEVNCKHVAAALFVLRRRVGPPWPTAAALATDEPATKSAATRKPRPARASEEAEFWLAGLERSAPPRPDAAPAPPTKRLPFALRVVAPGRPVLQMYTAALRTDGQWGKVDPYRRSAREIVYNPPRHVDDAEMELLLRLTTLPADVHGMYLYGRSAVPMLRAVADNGRLWRDPPAAEQPPLRWGGSRPGSLVGAVDAQGRQRLRPRLADAPGATLASFGDPTFWLEGDAVGTVDLDLPAPLAHRLFNGPPLSEADVAALAPRLDELAARWSMPLPKLAGVQREEIRGVAPIPLLHLYVERPAGRGKARSTPVARAACLRLPRPADRYAACRRRGDHRVDGGRAAGGRRARPRRRTGGRAVSRRSGPAAGDAAAVPLQLAGAARAAARLVLCAGR